MDKTACMQRAVDLARTRMRKGRGHRAFGCVIYGSDFTPLRNDFGKPIHERAIDFHGGMTAD